MSEKELIATTAKDLLLKMLETKGLFEATLKTKKNAAEIGDCFDVLVKKVSESIKSLTD